MSTSVVYTRKEPIIYKDIAKRLRQFIRDGNYSNEERPGLLRSIDFIDNLSGLKTYGITRYVDGKLNDGDRCILVDDLITTAESKIEAKELIELEARRLGIKVDVIGVCVLLDREQGGKETLEENGLTLISLATISEALNILHDAKILSDQNFRLIRDYTNHDKLV
jgi:orotate phosphoribosyltransferase